MVDWIAQLHVIDHVSVRLLLIVGAQGYELGWSCASLPLVHTKFVLLSNICNPLYVLPCVVDVAIPKVLLYTETLLNIRSLGIAAKTIDTP